MVEIAGIQAPCYGETQGGGAVGVDMPERLLMGPGPSPVPPSVRLAMARPVVGHLDPAFLTLMDEVVDNLRGVFGTANRLTLPLSGTGSAGMETAVVNWVQPGSRVLVVRIGVFGDRLADAAKRQGAAVDILDAPWGEPVDPDAVVAQIRRAGPYDVVGLVLAETSTGVLQPLGSIADTVHEQGGLLLVDAVTALGGVPVDVDRSRFDIVFAGTQKCLAVPPGLAPFTANAEAVARLDRRTAPPPSWYFDVALLSRYWGEERFYHHTAPVSMVYALAEGLRLIRQEGLTARYARHRRAARALAAGLEALDLRLLVEPPYRLPSLTTVRVPDGCDEAAVRRRLMDDFGIEIGGGLGALKGRIWRIGTMGEGARKEPILRVLGALEACLGRSGGVAEAARVWEEQNGEVAGAVGGGAR
jgi:alanine-glyoxylate transaminase/serine-glyoxylate transaminase/serine-pyruvate transaminase